MGERGETVKKMGDESRAGRKGSTGGGRNSARKIAEIGGMREVEDGRVLAREESAAF